MNAATTRSNDIDAKETAIAALDHITKWFEDPKRTLGTKTNTQIIREMISAYYNPPGLCTWCDIDRAMVVYRASL